MRDHGASNLSVGSSASMSDDDDDDDDTTVEIEQPSKKMMETNCSSSFSQDERRASRDPEERLDLEDRLGIHREDGQQNIMKLFKVANTERVRREGKQSYQKALSFISIFTLAHCNDLEKVLLLPLKMTLLIREPLSI